MAWWSPEGCCALAFLSLRVVAVQFCGQKGVEVDTVRTLFLVNHGPPEAVGSPLPADSVSHGPLMAYKWGEQLVQRPAPDHDLGEEVGLRPWQREVEKSQAAFDGRSFSSEGLPLLQFDPLKCRTCFHPEWRQGPDSLADLHLFWTCECHRSTG